MINREAGLRDMVRHACARYEVARRMEERASRIRHGAYCRKQAAFVAWLVAGPLAAVRWKPDPTGTCLVSMPSQPEELILHMLKGSDPVPLATDAAGWVLLDIGGASGKSPLYVQAVAWREWRSAVHEGRQPDGPEPPDIHRVAELFGLQIAEGTP